MSERAEAAKGFKSGKEATSRPDGCEDCHLEYLEELRESGITNMFGARPYLMNAYPDLDAPRAGEILGYWMSGGK